MTTLARSTDRTAATRLRAAYVGGFLGPFGSLIVLAMLPEIAAQPGTSTDVAGWSVLAYLLPFAVFMLVSGTLGDLWGRRRTVRAAYLLCVAASVLCALAPTVELFLAGRALQGLSNSFTTPLLVAALHDAVPAARLGRALGYLVSFQSAGMAFAPLAGWIAAEGDYSWGFVAVAALRGFLSLVPPSDPDPARHGAVPQAAGQLWRALATRGLARISFASSLFNLTTAGVMVLAALFASDRFGFGPAARGAVVAAFGIAGLLAGGRLGHARDRIGMRRLGPVL